jgi:hypothetical protein
MAVGIFGAFGAAGLHADDDKQKIDCGDTDLNLSAPGYEVTCTDLSKGTIDVDSEVAGSRSYKLFAESQADATFLVVLDDRPVGNRIFIKRRSLQDSVERYFNGVTFSQWAAGTSVAQFDVNNVSGEMKDGGVLECIGFQHQGPRRYEGIARLVVGIACSARGREHDYEALKHLQAPSG